MDTRWNALALAAAIVIAAVILGYAFVQGRATDRQISVVGSASKSVESGMVKWSVTVGKLTGLRELGAGYSSVARETESVLSRIRASGIKDFELTVQPPSAQPTYGESRITGYMVVQSFFLTSTDMDGVEKLALKPGDLVSADIILQGSTLQYLPLRLDELKREILGAAAQDARRRADEIARTSSLSVDRLLSARAGVFQIREPYSTEVESYGIYDVTTRKKEVTVTVSATFAVR